MTRAPSPSDPARAGVLLGLGAYLSWGLMPLYLKLLQQVPPLQIVAHRVVWSLLLLAAIVVLARRLPALAAAVRDRRTLLLLSCTALLIAFNWLVYAWAVVAGHVLEASLGYFISPLINVALGYLFLRERLRRLQWAAVALAAIGVLLLAAGQGGALWISLGLAASFAVYGLLRKVARVAALEGLAIETALLAPLGLAYLLWIGATGDAAFGRDRGVDLLLLGAGIVTTVPLLMFAGAARRLRYATLGLIQYLAPTLQFLEAVLLFGEPLGPLQLATFVLIWTGLALYALDGFTTRTEPAR